MCGVRWRCLRTVCVCVWCQVAMFEDEGAVECLVEMFEDSVCVVSGGDV